MRIKNMMNIAFICSIFFSSCSNDDNSNDPPKTLKDDIENKEFVKTIEDNVSDLPKNVQIAIAIIDNESTEYIGVYNDNNVLRKIDNADKIFEIGSITKIFTGICFSKLIATNKATLTETLQNQFDFPLQAGGDITLMQLANHTSGLPRLPTNIDEIIDFNPKDPFASYTPDNLKSYLQSHVVLNAESGAQYEYSNLGMGMFGYILSKKMMTSYEELLQKQIFEPLQMFNSTTLLTNVDAEKLVPGCNESGDAVQNWNFTEVLTAAGSIKSSVTDLEKFVHKNFEDDMVYNLPQKTTFEIGGGISVGLGWHVHETEGFRVLTHSGGTSGYASYLAIDKRNKKAIIVLSNVSGLTESTYGYKISELGADLLGNISVK
ncbi:serine hydrolase domain-containing protein [Aquimarina aquimarini]|uniref:serine hydrolase domain-containing protein n=1 Tax=Aquimarina aquimarini TaxID=1191734 RepID=UPI000D55FC88|nr:serine hydrolase domain-containing protein [Aquimarina aquimarini]